MMKKRPVKTKIVKLIKKLGSRQAVAERLGISLRYVYHLENGRVPGKFLYRYISQLDK